MEKQPEARSRGKVLMVQGTASHVGKSVVAAALCRIFRQDGFRVAPFKAQNMSNNSYVTLDGGEIGRAQAVQAEAAGIEPLVEMNPILLKPEADNRSQVVLLGKPVQSAGARWFDTLKPRMWDAVSSSLDKLRELYGIVVIEGAGSPAEINLKRTEIVNMRVALYADAPVLLVGDIDRGGVFAFLVGTLELLDPAERECVKAFIINKFRGDLSLLAPGLDWLEERTGIPVAGILPYFHDIHIPEEDSVSLEERTRMKRRTDYLLDVAVIGHRHISNFDDFDPLKQEEGVRLRFVEDGDGLGEPDLIILPGTKSTIADLRRLKRLGLANEIVALARRGTPIIGICGGYQMLGQRILDPDGVESPEPETPGLGLLPVSTVFEGTKETHRVKGMVRQVPGLLEGAVGLALEGYEIHMGRSHAQPERRSRRQHGSGNNLLRPFQIQKRSGRGCEDEDGAMDSAGRVMGTYIHGLFHNPGIRKTILSRLAAWKGVSLVQRGSAVTSKDMEYDKLAHLVRESLDMDLVYQIAGLSPKQNRTTRRRD